MATLRFKALGEISQTGSRSKPSLSDKKISDYFGADVFDREKMRQYLSKEAYESVCDAIDEGRRIDRKVANQVAARHEGVGHGDGARPTTRTGSSR